MANDPYDAPQGVQRLTSRQLELHRALGELDPTLALFYEGAMFVLTSRIPDRLALAAHNIREILDKLPRFFDLPVESSHTPLGSKANNFRDEWDRLLKRTKCLNEGTWSGEVDGALAKFLHGTGEFMNWMDEQRPRKREHTANVLRALDSMPLPDALIDQSALMYLSIRGFFVGVAHHGGCTDDDFLKWMNGFERFLHERLVPRTNSDFEAIDRIIAGALDANG